jgi:hypothetical protein
LYIEYASVDLPGRLRWISDTERQNDVRQNDEEFRNKSFCLLFGVVENSALGKFPPQNRDSGGRDFGAVNV